MAPFDLYDRLTGFDEGTLSAQEYLELMGHVVQNASQFKLWPGSLVRHAIDAYAAGFIDGNGNVKEGAADRLDEIRSMLP
jgi:hypothetical protein